MKSRTLLSLAAAAMFLMVPSGLVAQNIFVGGGLSLPTGEFGDYADTGWLGVAGMLFPVGDAGLHFGFEGFYGQNNHTDVDGDKTNVSGLMGVIEYDFGDPDAVGFYIFGGAGWMRHKFTTDTAGGDASATDNNFGYEGGAGVGVPVGGSTSVWVEGRYMGSSGTNFVGIMAGLSFGLSG